MAARRRFTLFLPGGQMQYNDGDLGLSGLLAFGASSLAVECEVAWI